MPRKDGLADIVPRNLFHLRKASRMTQEEFRKPIKVYNKKTKNKESLGRSGYNRKETGKVPITLNDLDYILDEYSWIKLHNLFAGHAEMELGRRRNGLTKEARARFPYLEHIVILANSIAEAEGDYSDELASFRQLMKDALGKIPLQKGRRGRLRKKKQTVADSES